MQPQHRPNKPAARPQFKIKRFIFVTVPAQKVTALSISALLVFGAMGAFFLSSSKAATYTVVSEAESGNLSSPDLRVTDSGASHGSAVKFGPRAIPSPLPPGPAPAGNPIPVSTSDQLKAALANAKPGDTITLADGTYNGQFNSTKSGSASAPITVVGSRKAVINGGALTSGYTFSLGTKNSASAVSYWKLSGFTITGGQKGIIFDNVQNSSIDSLAVQNTGQEGIHLRNFSSNNIIHNTIVTKTGQADQQFGEGLYIGTAQSNWSTVSQGKPDRSNNNQLLDNTISSSGAENIDVKEGTHAGRISGNSLDGTGMCALSADCNFADSLVDMKGEGWTISNNTAKHVHTTWSGAENDAFQVHVISQAAGEGSGNNNVFSGNRIDDVGGFGFNVQSNSSGVVVKCDNTATNSGKGLSNLACSK